MLTLLLLATALFLTQGEAPSAISEAIERGVKCLLLDQHVDGSCSGRWEAKRDGVKIPDKVLGSSMGVIYELREESREHIDCGKTHTVKKLMIKILGKAKRLR